MKFSVIIPLYNKGPYIARSMESVLNQTYQDFELLVIDDASTDDSAAIAHSFSDPRIRHFRRNTPGSGGYAARNLGVKNACNEWIAFLDADDLWKPDYLKSIVELHEQFPTARALTSAYIETWKGNRTSLNAFAENAPREARQYNWKDFLSFVGNGFWPFWTGVCVFLKEDLDAAGGFPDGRYPLGGDLDTWFRTLQQSQSWAYSPNPQAIRFRVIPNQVTRKYHCASSFLLETFENAIAKETNAEVKALIQECQRKTLAKDIIGRAQWLELPWNTWWDSRTLLTSQELRKAAFTKVEYDFRAFRRMLPVVGKWNRRQCLAFLFALAFVFSLLIAFLR